MKPHTLRHVLSSALFIALFFLSVAVLNTAVLASMFRGKELTFSELVQFSDFSPLSLYELVTYEHKPIERPRGIANALEFNQTRPADSLRFQSFVFERYFGDVLTQYGMDYDAYIAVKIPPRSERHAKTVSNEYPGFSKARDICFAVLDHIQLDLDHTGAAIAGSRKIDCQLRPRTKEYFSKLVLSGIDKAFLPLYQGIRATLLKNRTLETTRKSTFYTSEISFENIDLSGVQSWCEVGVSFMCAWLDNPRYILSFQHGYKHRGILRANDSEVLPPNDGPLIWLAKSDSVLMEVSSIIVKIEYAIQYDREVSNYEEYFHQKATTKISVAPVIQNFESLLWGSNVVDTITVDISLSKWERAKLIVERVFTNFPAAIAAIFAMINMVLMLSLLLRGNIQQLKKVVKRQVNHDLD